VVEQRAAWRASQESFDPAKVIFTPISPVVLFRLAWDLRQTPKI